MKLEDLRAYVWKNICIGYDDSIQNIKANCIIDIDEIIDLIYKRLKKKK